MSADLTVDDLRAVVAELLETTEIADDEDLALRGMDSLRMMRVLTRLRARGRGIRFSAMAQTPTIAGWWAASERLPAGAAPVAGTATATATDEPFELTPVQYAYWAGRDERLPLGGVGAQYYVELDGAGVSPARLRSALHRLTQRHPMLRAVVDADGRQHIPADATGPRLQVYPAATDGDLDERRRELAAQPLDPAAGHVFDVALSLLDGGRTRLHLTIDMMVADADSFRVMLNDLEAIYRGEPLPSLNYTFGAYVADMRETAAAAAERARPYWQERLATLPRPPQLPTVPLLEATVEQRRIHRRHLRIPAERTARLEEKARKHGLSLSTALLTAYAEVVAAHADQDRFLLTLPFYLREQVHEDVGAVVGDFTNLLLLDCDLTGSGGFAATALRLQDRLYADADNVAYSAVSVLRDLTRQWGEPALAPVVFTSAIGIGDLYSPRVRQTLGDPVWTISQVPQTLLDCQVLEFDGGVLVNWDCADGMFAEGVLDGMFDAFSALLDWLDREDWTAPVPSLVPAAQAAVRAALNDTPAYVSDDVLWSGLWGVDGGRVALVGGSGVVSFDGLRSRVVGVVGFLRSLGVGPGVRVGVCLPKGVDQVAVAVGVSAAGCVYVPMSPEQPVGRRAAMCAAADVGWVFSAPGVVWPSGVGVLSAEEAFAGPAGVPVVVSADETAYVIFTSGSTGVPKGVMVSHRQALNTIADVVGRFDVTAADRVLAVSGLDFDLSVFDVFGVLGVGGALVLPSDEQRRDAVALVGLCRSLGVTVWNSVPALLEMACVAAGVGGGLPSLRLVMVSGDWVRPDLAVAVESLVPGARFVALGGATEAAIWSNYFEVSGVLPGWSSVPYGRPLAGQAFRVVDGRGRDCPDWVVGELWIGGAGVAQGYAGDVELTAAKFVVGGDGRRWYRTGDLGRYRPGGVLEILGRRDGQVKLRGHRIETGEVENALISCPGVRQACVVLTTAGGAAALVAYVVGDIVEGQVIAELGELLPAYMIPRWIVAVDALPLTANGKVDRGALVARPVDGGAEPDDEPQGELEKLIAETWAEVLGLPTVGRGHNFFTLGGDSLAATRVIARLGAAGLPLVPLRALFDSPTVAALATQVTGAAPVRASLRQAPGDRHLPFPLTEVQRAYEMGRHDAFILGGIGSQSYWEFDAPGLDVAALEHALAAVVERHDMLRAVCTGPNEQVVLRDVPPYRIGVFPDRVELQAQVRDAGLDATQWPPFAVGVAEGRLGIALNHTTFDARSAMIFINELGALLTEPDLDLSPLGLSFRDYVLGYDHPADAVAAARAYWREMIAAAPEPPRLPLARDLATISRPRFERRELFLDPQQWQRLATRAREHGVTPSSLLAAVYAETVSRWSEGQDLLLLTTTFDRPPVHPDIDDVVGDFTNLTLVAYRPAGRTFWESAADLQGTLWAGMDHRALSGIEVLRELAAHHGRPFVPVPVVFTSALGMPDAQRPLTGPLGRYVHGLSQTPQTLLDCQVMEFDGGVLVNWDCVTEAFPRGVVDDMFAGFRRMLSDLDDDLAVDAVPTDQRAVREALNSVPPIPSDDVLWSGLWGVDGGRVALVGGSGVVSFDGLRSRVVGVVGFLRSLGVGPGVRVGVCLPKGVDQVAVAVGVSAAGCVYVPMSPEQPVGRRAAMCAAADVGWVFSAPGVVWPSGVGVLSAEEAFAGPAGVPVVVSADETAYVIFTSGSTGVPKGVMVSHRQALNTIADVVGRFDVTAADRVLAVSGLDFDLSVFDVFGVLGVGGALVLPSDEQRRDAVALVGLCRSLGVTVWNSVPALLEMACVAAGVGGGLPSLRLVMVSGDWVRPDLAVAVESLVPGARFVALGGATEAAIWSNYFEVSGVLPGWSSVPYGRPLAGQAFRVVDGRGRDCPDWVVGELWIGGAGVAQGYAGDVELTAAKFVVGGDGRRWYRTGDLGRYRPGGVLEILGRRDGQVKLRGHRIETGEVENALISCPGVRQAVAVVSQPGTSQANLVGYVVGAVDVDDVRQALTDLLPAYMIPRWIVAVDALPLTANGKVDRGALATRPVDGGAEPDDEPQGELEKLIAETWAEVLGLPTVGRGHNFFTLGGDSLAATTTTVAIQKHTGITVSLRQIYESATVASLAEVVAAARGDGAVMEEGVV